MSVETFKQTIGLLMVNELVRNAPVDKGLLRQSIRYEVKGDNIEFNMIDYALFVEYGTVPHVIKAKNAKALHWKSGGKDVFAKWVNHPGTKAQPFIRNSFYHKLKGIIEKSAELHLDDYDIEVSYDDSN